MARVETREAVAERDQLQRSRKALLGV